VKQLVSFVFLELAFDRLTFALNLKQDNIKSKRRILQLLTTTLLSSKYLKLAFSGFGTYKRKNGVELWYLFLENTIQVEV
jgi:hypothetical protein